MKDVYDIYVLSNKRKYCEALSRFESTFLVNAGAVGEEYVYPQFSDSPEFITDDYRKLLLKLLQNKNEEHAIYWCRDEDESGIVSVMLFFTDDGHIIFGLTVLEDKCAEVLDKC